MNIDASSDHTAHVLWTGGWDSTFRILDLVLNHSRTVQPHYLISPGRPSAETEMNAMARMRERIEERMPRGAALLPTQFINEPDIADDPEITAAWKRLTQRHPLGVQYEVIARYATMQDLTGLELSVHVDDRAYLFLDGYIETIDDAGTPNYVLRNAPEEPDINLVFGRLRFPILHISKLDMQNAADNAGFRDIMEMTWFCHTPRHNKPCGMCYPCRFAMQEGMARRLPFPARTLCRLVLVRSALAKHPLARKLLKRQRQSP